MSRVPAIGGLKMAWRIVLKSYDGKLYVSRHGHISSDESTAQIFKNKRDAQMKLSEVINRINYHFEKRSKIGHITEYRLEEIL